MITRTLSMEEGLPSAGTFALCEDRDGFLWVGTLLRRGTQRQASVQGDGDERGRGVTRK
ncbi:MAG: hypothetical protein IPL52_11165 [Flavobacteriales bacterium]|nr:hypothetical protein [Flavobacteriales bacterium]